MDRRYFLKSSGICALSVGSRLSGSQIMPATAAEMLHECTENPNLADFKLNARTSASSYVEDPPWGYKPENVFGSVLHRGWQADGQTAGAWIEIAFPELRQVSEIWILAEPLSSDVLGQDVYLMTHSRAELFLAPRKIRISLSDGSIVRAELLQAGYFQIIALPRATETQSLRLTIDEVWTKPGGRETGIGKIRVFQHRHSPTFEVVTHSMYGARGGRPVQAATVSVINPDEQLHGSTLRISRRGEVLMSIQLQSTPARAVLDYDVWIPAPYENSEMEFEVVSASTAFSCMRSLMVPKYSSYFDGGTYEINCTNHNDLGWLDTQKKTADYRSSSLILPALDLMQKYPEFLYTMECTAYLMEFLDRHPEKRDEMATMMKTGRFAWGASYVELLELSAGPEKLVRQFYLGRRWLKNAFPGVDTHLYMQTDPPSMSLQMPQILARAGVKYCLLGRLPFGFYHWQSPDGSKVLTYGYRYVDPDSLMDLKSNSGWLHFAEEREQYYRSNHLPTKFIYDYTSDYLPPQPGLVPYVRSENENMEQFANAWNAHFDEASGQKIKPPRIGFTTPERFLDEFTKGPLNLVTLRGDWPLSWAYYDEPSNREALLNGRHAHNELLAAEGLFAALGLGNGFADYPAERFAEGWRSNLWPDHGWGGNHGTITDEIYADSYKTSKRISAGLLADAGVGLTKGLPDPSASQFSLAVYNPLSWKRTDLVECTFAIPQDWVGWTLVDDAGDEVPCEAADLGDAGQRSIFFIARDVPPIGFRSFVVKRSTTQNPSASVLNATTIENNDLRLTFGRSGIQSLYHKQYQWEVLRTDKFDGGEIVELSAPGNAWEDTENVGTNELDRTAFHDFPFISTRKTPIRTTATREANFQNFTLRQHFHLYSELDRVDIDIEIQHWNGTSARELRVAFPINLDQPRLSYEVPFAAVEMGKDELDVSLLPSAEDSSFLPAIYGGMRIPRLTIDMLVAVVSPPHSRRKGPNGR
jgi:alpha-mannosidase